MISPDCITTIKQTANIVDVIGEYVKLKKVGSDYVGVDNNMGCRNNDVVLVTRDASTTCYATKVTATGVNGAANGITVLSNAGMAQNDNSKNRKLMIYQLLPRLFGNRQQTNVSYGTIEQNGSGKFEDISDRALDGIKELGTTHVWFTGVILSFRVAAQAACSRPMAVVCFRPPSVTHDRATLMR